MLRAYLKLALPPARFKKGERVKVADLTAHHENLGYPSLRAYQMSFGRIIGMNGTIVEVTDNGMTSRAQPNPTRLYHVDLDNDFQRTVIGEHNLEREDEFFTPPGAPDSWGTCVLCGEGIGQNDEPAEMYGDPVLEHGVGPDEVSYGLVHAQCGLDRGWQIA